jgi:hypothetical protein
VLPSIIPKHTVHSRREHSVLPSTMGAEQSTESQHPNESGKPLPTEPPPPEMVPISKLQIPIRSGSIGHITSAAAIDAHRPTDMIATAPDASARAEAARSTSFLHRLPALALPLTGKEHSVLTSTMGADAVTTPSLPAKGGSTTYEFESGKPIGLQLADHSSGAVVVVDVVDGTLAQQKGIMTGMTLLAVNGQSVAARKKDDALNLVRSTPAGAARVLAFSNERLPEAGAAGAAPAEQSTESRHPKESVQPLPPEPAPPVMVPTSNLQIPIGRITSAVAIDAHRPTATTDPTQDAALAEPSPPQDSIRKLTYGQLLVRALTMKGQLAMQREDERQAHVEVERLRASAEVERLRASAEVERLRASAEVERLRASAEVERLRASQEEQLRAQRAEIVRVREQLALSNARVVEAERALAARVDADTASQREQNEAAAKKAANEKAAAAKKAVDEKAAADKAAAERAAADKKAADEKAAAEKAAAEKAAAINAVEAKAAADKAAADSKREKAVVDLRQRLAIAFDTVAPGPAEEAHKRSEEMQRRIDTHWALLWSRVDLGYALRNLSPLRLQAEPTAIAMLGDALKPDLDVLVGVYLKFSARAEAHGEGVVLKYDEGVVLNSWSDLVVKEARWADYEVAERIFHCVLGGRTRLDNVASPQTRKLEDPRAHPELLGLYLSLPEFLQALVLLAVDRKMAVRTSSTAAVADDALYSSDALDVVGDAVADTLVPVIKPTRAGSGSVHWQPTTDDWAEPRTPQRASLSVHDLITAVKKTVSEMTAASTNADTPNLAHVLACRERWVSDASSEGLRLHAVRRLLEPMLLHLFKQIEAKQAAHGEGGGSAPLSSPLAVFEYLVDSARFASSIRKLEPRLVYLCAAALHDRAEPHPLDQHVGPVLTEAVVRYACCNGADERCGLVSLALTSAQLLAPWLVPTSESDLPGLREQLELVLAAKSPRSAIITRGDDHALGRADNPGRGFPKQSLMTKGLGAGDCVPSWIPQPVHKGEACVWVKLESHVRDNSSPMFETRHPDNARDIKTTWPYHEEDFEKADMCEMLNIDEPNILRSELLQP